MDEPVRPQRLLTWALGTFHIVFFLASVVLLLYARGLLPDLLGILDTRLGLLLFGILWLTTWWSTRHALYAFGESWLQQRPEMAQVVMSGIIWGGANGSLFFLALLLLALLVVIYLTLVQLFSGGPVVVLSALPVLLFISLFGFPVACIIGGTVGLLLALLDATLLSLARWALGDVKRET